MERNKYCRKDFFLPFFFLGKNRESKQIEKFVKLDYKF